MINTAKAVASLRPNIEWSMNGDDVENITWHTQGVTPLTTAEVEAEVLRLEKESAAADKAKIAAHKSAVKKLAALGLNSLEVQAIIGGI